MIVLVGLFQFTYYYILHSLEHRMTCLVAMNRMNLAIKDNLYLIKQFSSFTVEKWTPCLAKLKLHCSDDDDLLLATETE